MTPAAVALFAAATCPAVAPVADAPGDAEVAPAPNARSLQLNGEGRALYRSRQFAEAYARFRGSVQASPHHLGAALNAACALARLERFGEAAREAAELVKRGYVPWAEEVLEVADLGALQVRPEMRTVREAIAEGRRAWAESVRGALFFVARSRPPVKLPAQGVGVLALHQEVFAWIPSTGRYRQITAEDGRVVLLAVAEDGRRLAYVRAGRLVRTPDAPAALRALSVRVLDTAAMALDPPAELPGDVTRLELRFPRSGPELTVTSPQGPRSFQLVSGKLIPVPHISPAAATLPAVVLDGQGTSGPPELRGRGSCSYRALDGAGTIRIRAGGRTVPLAARFGAGLHGLPFEPPAPSEPRFEKKKGEGAPKSPSP